MRNPFRRSKTPGSGGGPSGQGVSCEELVQVLIDYVDGNLPAGDRARLDEHFGDCPNCLAMMKTYRKTIDTARGVCADTMPAEVRRRLKDFLEEKMRGR